MSTLIYNDLHFGVKRQNGTTKESSKALGDWMLETFQDHLAHTIHDINLDGGHITTLVINGDLFDRFDVNTEVVVKVFKMLRNVQTTYNLALVIAAGNHDISRNTEDFGSLDLLQQLFETFQEGASLLGADEQFNQVYFVRRPSGVFATSPPIYIIPHLPTQAEFDQALSEVPKDCYVLLHCNYDNGFAAQTDHSLNLSREAALNLADKGVLGIILGHEHGYREPITLGKSKVYIPGNQVPSSIHDCQVSKFAATLITSESVAYFPRLSLGIYAELGVSEVLSDNFGSNTEAKFVKVVGEVTPEASYKLYKAVAKFRREAPSSCAVISASSVKVIQPDPMKPELQGAVTNFDLAKAISSLLTEEEQEVINKALGFNHAA